MKTQSDSQHLAPVVQIRIRPRDVKSQDDPLLSVLFPDKLNINHPFRSALLDGYQNDYKTGGLTALGKKGIQWAKRLRFTIP